MRWPSVCVLHRGGRSRNAVFNLNRVNRGGRCRARPIHGDSRDSNPSRTADDFLTRGPSVFVSHRGGRARNAFLNLNRVNRGERPATNLRALFPKK